MSSLGAYFLEMCAHALLKEATKSSLEVKNTEIKHFKAIFLRAETEECNQKDFYSTFSMVETVECNQESLGVFNKFGIIIPC